MCIMHTVYKMQLFLIEHLINMEPHSCIGGCSNTLAQALFITLSYRLGLWVVYGGIIELPASACKLLLCWAVVI